MLILERWKTIACRYSEREFKDFALEVLSGKPQYEAFKIACSERIKREGYSKDSIASLAKKLIRRPEVIEQINKLKEEAKAKIEARKTEVIENNIIPEILTEKEFWVKHTKLFRAFKAGEGTISEMLFTHVSKCFLEKFKDERAEQLEKEAEDKKPNLCFNDDLPEDD